MSKNSLFNALFVLFIPISMLGQESSEIIQLINPSFEDMPRHSKAPRAWSDCGFKGESAPDIQPSGIFSVTKPAADGNTYLGLVVRDNDTWESVGQELSRPLEKGKCYSFSIALCRSELYVSISRLSDQTANYTTPAKLRIYGGNAYCEKKELLAESPLIANTRWQDYDFKLEPAKNYSFLILEAYYKTPTLVPYNGNLLVDNFSDIKVVNCRGSIVQNNDANANQPEKKQESVVVKAETVRLDNKDSNVIKQKEDRPAPPPVLTEPKDIIESASVNNLKRTDIKKGQTLRIDKIFFEMDKSVFTKESYQFLNDLVDFLRNNPDISIEVGGHSNGLCTDNYCNKISTDRAKAVVDYLVSKNINRSRLTYKGYGKKFPIASNDTAEGRRKNQRVELKIISFNDN
ncbi:MAG: OmpA family protein [Bacteroidetes bacterium]|jgi:outer membrane protein OmpA-like peptidoglycan-associated protein|nr:OmpA family protein [Bacteroidota bacterium]